MLHQLLQTNHKLHWEMFLQVRMPNKFRIYAYFQIILALAKLFCTGWHYFRLVQIILDRSKSVWTGIPWVSWCSFTQPLIHTNSMTCFIYILDSSNSSSFTFWTSQFTSSSRCNWTGISTGNSNGSWTDKHSSHFSKAKEMSVKALSFFM